MTVIKYHEEMKFRVSPQRLFKALVTESHNILPKIDPTSFFKHIEILQGHGGAGSKRKLHFPDGAHMIDKIEAVDEEKLVVKYVYLEGPSLGDKIETIHSVQEYVDSGDGGCILKMTNEHHLKEGHTQLTEEDIKEGKEQGRKFFHFTEEYLIAHPDVCA